MNNVLSECRSALRNIEACTSMIQRGYGNIATAPPQDVTVAIEDVLLLFFAVRPREGRNTKSAIVRGTSSSLLRSRGEQRVPLKARQAPHTAPRRPPFFRRMAQNSTIRCEMLPWWTGKCQSSW